LEKLMSRLSLGQLEAFVWTARLGSVEQAARHLHLAQPSVSLRLRDLQAALGTRLLQRAGRGIRLTGEGRMLLDRAQSILHEVENLQAGERELGGLVRFGLAEGFAAVCVPPLMAALRQHLPKLQVDLTIATSGGLEQDLGEDRLDLAVLVDPVGLPTLRLVPLGLQETVWAAAPALDLPAGARPQDLWQVPVLTTPPPSPMFRQAVSWFATARLDPAKLNFCSSVTVISQLIAAGIGIGVMPARLIAPYREAGTIVALTSSPPLEPGRVFVSYRAVPRRAIEAVIRVLDQVLQAVGYFTAPEPPA
jgi:DNA-binding transcriptional LysR family regulator